MGCILIGCKILSPESGIAKHNAETINCGRPNDILFQKHQELAKTLGIKIYFCFPYHSWERGTNENTNGLIREDFPKKTDFTQVSEENISMIEYKLNTRPRKRLNYLTPLEAFSVALEG